MTREDDKLVRDDIPTVIEADGEQPVTNVAESAEYERRLFEKLDEETTELREDRSVAERSSAGNQNSVSSGDAAELADVLELLDALRTHLDVDEEELTRIREEKAAERGRFEKGVVLERVES